MAAGPCLECGAGEVRCKGLCPRCYVAERRRRQHRLAGTDQPTGGVEHAEGRRLERAWGAHQLTVALIAEAPRPGRWGPSWTALAACRDRRDLPWEGTTNRRATAAMRAVCAACPVRAPCLAEALRDNVDGVWAATTPAERAAMRR